MPFISVSEDIAKKAFTYVENKFITKYLPVLEPMAVKIYIYALYLGQNGRSSFTLSDFAQSLQLAEDDVKNYFEYLEEFELVSVTSVLPFEVKILDAENVVGTPKKFKPEKYSDFTKAVQNVLKGRMISPNEFREYFYLLEEYGFEQNALVMIINYCVNLKGDDIRFAYIKKVAKTFADEGIITAKKVDEKLSAYTSVTPTLLQLFNAVGIRKTPDIDDDKLYRKWTVELGFEYSAISAAAKFFKAKTTEKIDAALEELYKNHKYDIKEIEDYCNTKNSVYNLTFDIAKNLGVYMQNPTPYVENYVNIWCDYGFSFDSLKQLSVYCFKNGKNSFEDMNSLIQNLFDNGIIADVSVNGYITDRISEDKLLKEILSACGLTRKVVDWDRQSLSRWRSWNFGDDMLFEAAKLSSGKSNPMAYMNGILSAWKSEGIFTVDKITSNTSSIKQNGTDPRVERAEIERHYFELRQAAEARAERAVARATEDEIYGKLRAELNNLSIELAFAEIRDPDKAKMISEKIDEYEKKADMRLKELKIDKSEFIPKYSCNICNDTGYDKNGNPCECLNRFIASLKS